ncbi:Serpentine type 7TM GPCR chemoreceptor Srsx family protein [Brugia pahangi]
MKRITCYHSLFLYCYSFNMSSVAILFLAIDRFIAVRSPLKYRTARSAPFVALAIGTGFTYSTLFVIAGFLFANDNLVEPCDQTMAYSPILMEIWNYGSVSIAMAVFIINVIDYYLLRNVGKQREIHERDYAAYQRQNQFTTSMLITMVANCLTSLLSAFALFVVNLLPVSTETTGGISSYLCLLLLFNYGNNYYILFWRSHTYRTKFLEQLHLIRCGATVGFTERIATITKKHKWFHR